MVAISLPGGKPIRFRTPQTLLWSIVAAVLGAGFVAGLYFGILEVNWGIFWLKPGWDNLFHQQSWATYRHEAFRDIPEPAFAVMGVKTLLAKRKNWAKRVSILRLSVTPPLVIALTLALGVFGTWLLNFAFGHPVLQWENIGNILLGVIIGHFMQYLWGPVGASIQGRLLEHPVDKAANAHPVPSIIFGTQLGGMQQQVVPVWIKYPLTPPPIRERFTLMYSGAKSVKGNLYERNVLRHWIIAIMVLVFVAFTLLGLYGHYWVGAGHAAYFFHTTKGAF